MFEQSLFVSVMWIRISCNEDADADPDGDPDQGSKKPVQNFFGLKKVYAENVFDFMFTFLKINFRRFTSWIRIRVVLQ